MKVKAVSSCGILPLSDVLGLVFKCKFVFCIWGHSATWLVPAPAGKPVRRVTNHK